MRVPASRGMAYGTAAAVAAMAILGFAPSAMAQVYNFTNGIINSSGYIGVGTTNPGAFLDVNGAGTLPLMLETNSSGPWSIILRRNDLGSGSDVDIFNSGGTFYVKGNGSYTGNLSVSGSFSGTYTGTLAAGNISAGTFGANTGGGNYTFPAAAVLNSMGTAQIDLNSAGTYWGNISNPSSQVWALGYGSGGTTIGTPVLAWNASGNVGIGTTAPAQKLEVNGNAQIDGALYLTNANSYLTQAGGFNTYTSTSSLLSTNYTVTNPVYNSGFYLQNEVPYNLNYVAGDNSMPYGYAINDPRTGEHAGFLAVPNNSSGGPTNMVFYVGNDGGNNFEFVPFTWDGSNNHLGNPVVTIGAQSGNMTVTGTITAGGFSGPLTGTESAANVSAGTFGSNTGGGNYTFPAGLYTNGFGISLTPAAELDYWGGSTPYRTWMDNNSTYFYGAVKDYAIHFTMDAEDSGRGFTWGAYGSQPSMSVDINGNLSIKANFTPGGNIIPSVTSNSGGGTWYFGSSAWGGNGPAPSGVDSVTGFTYTGGSGSQLVTFSSGPGQTSLQNDGSVFVGDSASPYNPLGINGSSDGYLLVDNGASVGGSLYVNGSLTLGGVARSSWPSGSNFTWNWSGQGGQPPWVWGGSDGTNMYVYNPSNFSVNYANTAGALSNMNISQFSNNSGYLTSSNFSHSLGTSGYDILPDGLIMEWGSIYNGSGGTVCATLPYTLPNAVLNAEATTYQYTDRITYITSYSTSQICTWDNGSGAYNNWFIIGY